MGHLWCRIQWWHPFWHLTQHQVKVKSKTLIFETQTLLSNTCLCGPLRLILFQISWVYLVRTPGMSATALCRNGISLVINPPNTSSWSYPRPTGVVRVQLGSGTFIWCHVVSYKVACVCFLLVTSPRKQKERCGWSHCVQLVKTYQLICILTFAHHLTLSRDFGSPKLKFWPWPFGV